MIEANWLIFVAALVVGIFVAWWLFGRGSKPQVRDRRPDVLDEGAAPAQRNQALIDAPPAAAIAPPPPPIPSAETQEPAPMPVAPAAVTPPAVMPPPAAATLGGIGEAVAHAARNEVQEAAPPVVETPAAVEDAGAADDLRRIKGVGPKLVTLLHGLGVTRYAQVAAWTDADLDDLDTKLGAFAGRPRRDSWVEQARMLAEGDTAAYEAKFGKL